MILYYSFIYSQLIVIVTHRHQCIELCGTLLMHYILVNYLHHYDVAVYIFLSSRVIIFSQLYE